VAGNVAFGLKGWPRAEAARRLDEVAALCGVERLLGRRPATLSGGERQRVGLARALAPRPRLLLCDEPVSALDLAGRNALVDRLRAVQAAEAVPVLYVTHSPAEAVALGARLFLLDGGRVVAEGPPLDVLAAARPGVPARLEGVRNTFSAVVEGDADGGATRLRLADGPELVVARLDLPAGSKAAVSVLAEEILLGREPFGALSARNVIAGEVVRVLPHGHDAEVLVRTGGLTWICSVVAPAVDALGLRPGAGVSMIIKARSCHVRATGRADSP
jgi:molybdate transport system ATP-binding protein